MALENDTQAPDFELLDQHGRSVRLSDFRGSKAVALVFFPLAFSGTPWQITVWDELTRIPYGTRRTYAEVAALLGRPSSARVVGSANAANRLPLVVPCHRVVGADGSLTGFAGGMHLKERLLAHESRVAMLRR